jgi:hypothetical protein
MLISRFATIASVLTQLQEEFPEDVRAQFFAIFLIGTEVNNLP